jgi:hypothetical protein
MQISVVFEEKEGFPEVSQISYQFSLLHLVPSRTLRLHRSHLFGEFAFDAEDAGFLKS